MPGSSFLFYLNLLAPHETQGGAKKEGKEMLKKLCSAPGCYKVVEAGVKYCDRHHEKDKERQRQRNRVYKSQRMQDKDEAARQKFYASETWKRFRKAQETRQLGIDVYEYYTTGRIIRAEEYHHIKEVKESWEDRFNEKNVIGLSKENHAKIHEEYTSGYVEKKRMQRTLWEMLMDFETEFG